MLVQIRNIIATIAAKVITLLLMQNSFLIFLLPLIKIKTSRMRSVIFEKIALYLVMLLFIAKSCIVKFARLVK